MTRRTFFKTAGFAVALLSFGWPKLVDAVAGIKEVPRRMFYWKAGANGRFTDPANWVGEEAPTEDDRISIHSGTMQLDTGRVYELNQTGGTVYFTRIEANKALTHCDIRALRPFPIHEVISST